MWIRVLIFLDNKFDNDWYTRIISEGATTQRHATDPSAKGLFERR